MYLYCPITSYKKKGFIWEGTPFILPSYSYRERGDHSIYFVHVIFTQQKEGLHNGREEGRTLHLYCPIRATVRVTF